MINSDVIEKLSETRKRIKGTGRGKFGKYLKKYFSERKKMEVDITMNLSREEINQT